MTHPGPVQPDPGEGGFMPAGMQQPTPPPPSRPKRTGVVVLTVVAVLLLGAAATFGALWLSEKGDHKQTTDQLANRDKELADEKKAHDGTKGKLTDAEKAKTDAEAKVTALTPCADAGKELARLALAAANAADATKAGGVLIVACGK
jgi:uncharacterized protein (DUF3084 family)